ncbi:hypothetical protein ACWPKS_02440 [Coraliomargarita sp. W4R72]
MMNRILPNSLFLLFFAGIVQAYTFTSSDGSQFDGEVLFVDSTEVEVRRSSDDVKFRVPKSRFSEADQHYFESWGRENPKLNLPGRGVTAISLRCKTARSNDESIIRETGRTLVDVEVTNSVYWDYDWITVETRVDVTARPEMEKVRLKGVTVHVQASSVSGPVMARIYTAFFMKSGSQRVIFQVDERNVKVGLGQGELYATCPPVENYYGYGTVAFNLATGKMIGIDASNHSIKQILDNKISRGDIR